MAGIVWKGYVSFGLVSFPIRLFAAARAETVHFHMLHKKDLSRVKEVWYCAAEDKPIERSDIVKGYEVSKGEYVVVEEEELKKMAPATATTMDIVQFVRDTDVDALYFEKSYYVAPGDNVTKPYALFFQALKETKFSALAKVSMHGREHVVLLRISDDQLVMHTLFYPDEMRTANKQGAPSKANTTRKELDLATELIRKLAGPFEPSQFHDAYRENVEKLIEQKQKGEKITAAPKQRKAPVIDLMEALKRSIMAKPTHAAAAASKSTTASKTKRRRKAA
ncbi:MAG: Ku protein [Bryobacteraceae bacterium]